jgi:hypothetical protein
MRACLQGIDARIVQLRLLQQRQGDACAGRLAARLEREKASLMAGIDRPRAIPGRPLVAQRPSG